MLLLSPLCQCCMQREKVRWEGLLPLSGEATSFEQSPGIPGGHPRSKQNESLKSTPLSSGWSKNKSLSTDSGKMYRFCKRESGVPFSQLVQTTLTFLMRLMSCHLGSVPWLTEPGQGFDLVGGAGDNLASLTVLPRAGPISASRPPPQHIHHVLQF